MSVKSETIKVIEESVRDIFETVVFSDLFENPEVDYEELNKHSFLYATILLKGKSKGYVTLYCDLKTGTQITSNILGCDIDDMETETHVKDSMGEIANMIAGDIEVRLSDDEDLFTLCPPDVNVLGSSMTEVLEDIKGVILPFKYEEEGYVWINVVIEGYCQ